MKILHIIGGGDVGGAKIHVLSLVRQLSTYTDIKIVSLRKGVFSKEAAEMGLNVEVVHSGNIFKDIKTVIDIIKKGKAQILHSHGAKANVFSVLCRLFLGIPNVTTVHSDYKLDYMQNIFKRLFFGTSNAIALRNIKYHIGVSTNFKKMLIDRRFNPTNIFTVYNGMDFDEPIENYTRLSFNQKFKTNLSDSDIVIGVLARLHPVKGLPTLLRAAKEVLKHSPTVKFLIGGDGEQRVQLEWTAKILGISDSVIFVGWVDNSTEFMSIVDINVMTSISESFPYTILEAARVKKPTISTNVGGIPDLIDHGKNGYLFTPGDHMRLSELLLELISDKPKMLEMGENIYFKAKTDFSLESMFESQISIYEEILKREQNLHYDVVLSGYYGFDNIGDDAMLMAIIKDLKHYKKDIRIAVLSKNPEQTQSTYGVDSVDRFSFLNVLNLISNTSLFINGGGSLIQDNTSTRSVLYYLATIWAAKKMNKKVMIYANGIGPLKRKLNKKLASYVLNQVDVITIREYQSVSELNSLNVNKPDIFVTADAALTLTPASDKKISKILEAEGIDQNKKLIGFSIRKWDSCEYEQIVADIADYAAKQYGLVPVFIPMHRINDFDISNRILGKMKEKGYIIKNKYSVTEILGVMEKLEILVGMRLHALIFAASLGVPIIGLPYEPKVEGFLQYIGQASAGHVSCLNKEELMALLDVVYIEKESEKAKLLDAVAKIKTKALHNARIAIDLLER